MNKATTEHLCENCLCYKKDEEKCFINEGKTIAINDTCDMWTDSNSEAALRHAKAGYEAAVRCLERITASEECNTDEGLIKYVRTFKEFFESAVKEFEKQVSEEKIINT